MWPRCPDRPEACRVPPRGGSGSPSGYAPRPRTIQTSSRRVLRDPAAPQPVSQQVLAPAAHRVDAEPAQHLAGEPVRQQRASDHLVEPAALEIEDGVLRQLAIA